MFYNYLSRFVFCFFLVVYIISKIKLLSISPLSCCAALMVACIVLSTYIIIKKTGFSHFFSYINEKIYDINPIYIFAVILFTHAFLRILSIFYVQIDYTQFSDPATYVCSANELAQTGYITTWGYYYYRAPHMFWFAVFLLPAVKLFGASNTALSIYLALVSSLSSAFIGTTLYKRVNRTTAYLFMLIYAILPTAITSTDYITHEHALLFFLSLFIWLRFGIMPIFKGKSYVFWTLEIISSWILIVGSMTNGLGLVALVALLILHGLQIFNGHLLTSSMKIISLIFMMLFTHHFGNTFHLSHSHLSEIPDQLDQYKWVLYIGSNYESKGYFDPKARSVFRDTNHVGETTEEYHDRLILQNYKRIFSDVHIFYELYSCKLCTVLGVYNHSIISIIEKTKNRSLKESFLPLVMRFAMYAEAIAWGVLGLFVIIRTHCPKDDFFLWSSLFLTGATMLFMLTEVSSKYTIAMQPILYFFLLVPFVNYFRTKSV